MDGIWTTRTEQYREEILEATLKARGGHPWRTDASSTQKISKNHVEVVIWVGSTSSWTHGYCPGCYRKASVSRWTSIGRSPRTSTKSTAYGTFTSASTAKKSLAIGSTGWAHGDTSEHVQGLLEALENLLLAARVDGGLLARSSGRIIALPLRVAKRPLRPHETSRSCVNVGARVDMVLYVLFIRIVIVVTARAAKVVGTEVPTAENIVVG